MVRDSLVFFLEFLKCINEVQDFYLREKERFRFVDRTIMLLFLAMTRYPATIVSSIAAIQPLVVLFGERFLLARTNIVKDTELLPKLVSISFVILGVVVLVQAI